VFRVPAFAPIPPEGDLAASRRDPSLALQSVALFSRRRGTLSWCNGHGAASSTRVVPPTPGAVIRAARALPGLFTPRPRGPTKPLIHRSSCGIQRAAHGRLSGNRRRVLGPGAAQVPNSTPASAKDDPACRSGGRRGHQLWYAGVPTEWNAGLLCCVPGSLQPLRGERGRPPSILGGTEAVRRREGHPPLHPRTTSSGGPRYAPRPSASGRERRAPHQVEASSRPGAGGRVREFRSIAARRACRWIRLATGSVRFEL
jgi:hypothetical protein